MTEKIVVEVIARFDTAGTITPLYIIWADGRRLKIDRVTDRRRAASLKSGGQGIRYCVKIYGQLRYLWYNDMDNTWFVERQMV